MVCSIINIKQFLTKLILIFSDLILTDILLFILNTFDNSQFLFEQSINLQKSYIYY